MDRLLMLDYGDFEQLMYVIIAFEANVNTYGSPNTICPTLGTLSMFKSIYVA